MAELKKLYQKADVAKHFGISTETVDAWVAKGWLRAPYPVTEKTVYWLEEDLLEFQNRLVRGDFKDEITEFPG